MKNLTVQLQNNVFNVTSNSGEYEGEIKGETVMFMLIREDETFDEDNWIDILGSEHAFVQMYNGLNGEVDFDDDAVVLNVNKNKLIELK